LIDQSLIHLFISSVEDNNFKDMQNNIGPNV